MTWSVLLQSTNGTVANASMDVVNGFATSTGLVGPLVLVFWTVFIVGLVSALSHNEYFHRLIDALGWVARSIVYALHGVAALVLAGIAMAPAYFVATADPGTRQTVGKYVVGGLAVYALLVGVGYLAKHHLFDPIRSNVDGVLPDEEPDEGHDGEEVADA